jgi:ADP-ribose pyrophosphatase YjhB (NUDIX family)
MTAYRPAWRRAIEPLVRPAFHTLWRMKRPMTLGVRGVALDAQNRIMLVEHTYIPGWHLPGGGVESGEIAAHAMARELEEEAGLNPTTPLELIGVFANHRFMKNDHVLLFRCTAWEETAHNSAGEISGRGFFALDGLPDNLGRATKARIAELFFGADPSTDW